MAQINQINGVATSGTTGVNNLFGSGGGGGTPTESATPTFTSEADIRFSNTVVITNHASYTQGVQYKVESSLGGTAFDTQIVTGTDTIVVADAEATAGTRTITVTAQEYGDFYESAAATATYTKTATQFRYLRLQGANASKVWVKNNMGFDDFRCFSGSGQTGTKYPEDLTSLTSGEANGYYVDSNYQFSTSYRKEYAFDSNVNSWHWTLSCATADQNFSGFHFDATVFPTIPTISSWRCKFYNPSADRAILYGSNTGAFAGEETELDIISPKSEDSRTWFYRG